MSFARFSTNDLRRRDRRLRGRGRIHRRSARLLSAARAWCEIPNLQDLLRYICENGFEHHVAANMAHGSGAPCSEATDALSGLERSRITQ